MIHGPAVLFIKKINKSEYYCYISDEPSINSRATAVRIRSCMLGLTLIWHIGTSYQTIQKCYTNTDAPSSLSTRLQIIYCKGTISHHLSDHKLYFYQHSMFTLYIHKALELKRRRNMALNQHIWPTFYTENRPKWEWRGVKTVVQF